MPNKDPDMGATSTKQTTCDAVSHIPIKAIYGNVTMMKYWCEICDSYALVVRGEFQCCGRKVKQETTRCELKREADAVFARRGPSEKNKKKILEFQNYQCVYCGQSLRGKNAIEWDHFFCFSYSGNSRDLNFTASCKPCNRIKSAMVFSTMLDAQLYIRSRREELGLTNYFYSGGSYDVKEN